MLVIWAALKNNMYIRNIKLKSGETHYIFDNRFPTITHWLEGGFYNHVFEKFPLMDYIEEKYFNQPLEILCEFKKEVTAAHRGEIKTILSSIDRGEIW